MLLVAGIINAIGVTLFIAPVQLYDSGISGTSILLSQLTPDYLSLSFFLVLLNVPLLLFGFKLKENWKPFLLVNLVTQGLLHGCFSFFALQSGVSWFYFLLFFPALFLLTFAGCGKPTPRKYLNDLSAAELADLLFHRLLSRARLFPCRAGLAICCIDQLRCR